MVLWNISFDETIISQKIGCTIKTLDDSELESEYTTVGGWCIEKLDGVVSEADHFEYENLYVIISKMQDMRILSLTVVEREKTEEE